MTRIAPHIVDTLFLATGSHLAKPLHPTLVCPDFVFLRIKRGSNKGIRMGAFIGALCTFAYLLADPP